MAAHRNLGFGAKDRFFEFKIDIFPEIGASLGAAALARASPKNLTQAKEVAENIAQVVGIEALCSANPAQACVTVSVVGGALVPIRQHGVGLAALFEFIFRVGIVGIAVGMELERQFAIGALDLLIGS